MPYPFQEQNLLAEKELSELRRSLTALHHVVQEKKLVFDRKAQRQQQVMQVKHGDKAKNFANIRQQFTAASLLEKLDAAAVAAEWESDELARQFVLDPKSLPPQEFAKRFLDQRKAHHLRAAKVLFFPYPSPPPLSFTINSTAGVSQSSILSIIYTHVGVVCIFHFTIKLLACTAENVNSRKFARSGTGRHKDVSERKQRRSIVHKACQIQQEEVCHRVEPSQREFVVFARTLRRLEMSA